MHQVLWVGNGAAGRVWFWERDAAEALFTDAPVTVSASFPTCPYHPTFLSRTAPATDLAVMEVAKHSVLLFVGDVHEIKFTKGDNVDAESEIHFAISGVAPPPPPGAAPQVHEGWGMVDHLSV